MFLMKSFFICPCNICSAFILFSYNVNIDSIQDLGNIYIARFVQFESTFTELWVAVPSWLLISPKLDPGKFRHFPPYCSTQNKNNFPHKDLNSSTDIAHRSRHCFPPSPFTNLIGQLLFSIENTKNKI